MDAIPVGVVLADDLLAQPVRLDVRSVAQSKGAIYFRKLQTRDGRQYSGPPDTVSPVYEERDGIGRDGPEALQL